MKNWTRILLIPDSPRSACPLIGRLGDVGRPLSIMLVVYLMSIGVANAQTTLPPNVWIGAFSDNGNDAAFGNANLDNTLDVTGVGRNFAIGQGQNGSTILNAAAGRSIHFRVGNQGGNAIMMMDIGSINMYQELRLSKKFVGQRIEGTEFAGDGSSITNILPGNITDLDTYIAGTVGLPDQLRLGNIYNNNNWIAYGHESVADHDRGYALAQRGDGLTILNAASGNRVSFGINTQELAYLDATKFKIIRTIEAEDITAAGDVSAANFTGNGSGITNIQAENIENLSSVVNGVPDHVNVGLIHSTAGPSHATFGHSMLPQDALNYALTQSNEGHTFINSSATKQLHFRIGNEADKMTITSNKTIMTQPLESLSSIKATNFIGDGSGITNITVHPDLWVGRWKDLVGYIGWGHNDLNRSSGENYAFKQSSEGATFINSSPDKPIVFRSGNTGPSTGGHSLIELTTSLTKINNPINAQAITATSFIGDGSEITNIQAENIVGLESGIPDLVHLGPVSSNANHVNWASFGHGTIGQDGSNFAIAQAQNGVTTINAASGKKIDFKIGNNGIAMHLSSSELLVNKPTEITSSITATSFIGDGAGITNINANNIIGLDAISTPWTNTSDLLSYGAGDVKLGKTNSKTALTIQADDNVLDLGIAFQNSGGAYSWNIYRDGLPDNSSDLVISGAYSETIDNLDEVVRFKHNGEVIMQNIIANTFVGDGSEITNIQADNITGLDARISSTPISRTPTIDENAIPPLGITFQSGPGATNAQNWTNSYGTKISVWDGIARNFEFGPIFRGAGFVARTYDLEGDKWHPWREFIMADENGNVGIGTTNPTAMLDVAGTAKATTLSSGFAVIGDEANAKYAANPSAYETITQNGVEHDVSLWISGDVVFGGRKHHTNVSQWADFVFDEGYDLLPLEEVEAFIEENNHLPNVPSEAEVKENGYTEQGVNAMLLEKIEELTLYTIELNKQMKQMQSELTTLKGN
ncbi:MAG: hypothetical protein RIF33_05940 [Cyclobacteriaceae bacterium]